MTSAFQVDNNILWISTPTNYLEVTISFSQYADEKAMTMDFDLQGVEGEDTYPIIFISKKQIVDANELATVIKDSLTLANSLSDVKLSPADNSVIDKFAEDMEGLYM